jgi:O-antigen/teichoic acid export membrane protein
MNGPGGDGKAGTLVRGIVSNWGVNALQIAVLLFLTPYVLRTLGAELNGVWIAIVSMTGVLRLLVLGVPMASVRSIASAVGRGDAEGANRAVSTCLALTTSMAVVALAIGWFQLGVFETSYLGGALGRGLAPAETEAARIAFVLSAFQVAAAFAARLPYGVLEAHDDFLGRNAVMAGELVLRLGLTVALLPRHPSLETLAAIQVTTMLAEFAASWARIRLRHPAIRLGFGSFDRSLVGGILSFSVFAMLLNVGTLLAFRCDALVIGAFLDATATTEFDMGNKFFEPLTGFVIGIGAVVMPAASRIS